MAVEIVGESARRAGGVPKPLPASLNCRETVWHEASPHGTTRPAGQMGLSHGIPLPCMKRVITGVIAGECGFM